MCLALIIVCGGVTVSSDSQARPKASKKASKKSRSKTSKRKKIKSKRKKKKSVKRSKRKKKRVSLRKQPALSLSRLQKALQRSSSNQALSQAKVSYLFIDESGKVIASNHSEVLLHPASNIKIATTAAAYEILGADYQYHTQFYIHKDFVPIQNQSKKETATTKEQIPSTQLPILYWKASGDSKLTAKSLKKIAQQIKRYKIKKYQQLIIDDSDFTTDLAPGFADKPDDDAAYRAATGGIGYQFNAFITKVKPGKLKQKPIVEFVPNIPYLQLRNIATTSKKGKEALKIKLLAEQDNLIVELSGHIPIKHKGIQVRKRIADPFIFTAQTFLQCLKKEGISVVKGMRRGGLPLKESRVMIATHKSTTMKSLLSDVNFYSNNYMAEQTLLTLGLYQKKIWWLARGT